MLPGTILDQVANLASQLHYLSKVGVGKAREVTSHALSYAQFLQALDL